MDLDLQRRYARQIMLPEVGVGGQQKLADAKVLVIGAGGLGAPLITYLASCGIGTIGIIDDDRVELSNLPRQTMFENGDIGRPKVDAASDRVYEINPGCKVNTYAYPLDEKNAAELIAQYDLVADGCDNFTTRFVVNRTCIQLKKPLVSAAISGFQGQVMTVVKSPCYRCFVHPDAVDANTCRESGVMAPLAGLIGCAQALEVVRLILGFSALVGKLAVIDGITQQQRLVQLEKDATCPVCG